MDNNQSHKCVHHKCAKSGDNNRNVNNEGSSGGSTNTKFTASEDNRDKDKDDDNNNINSNEGPTLPKPMITNYYCYDQRVYKWVINSVNSCTQLTEQSFYSIVSTNWMESKRRPTVWVLWKDSSI